MMADTTVVLKEEIHTSTGDLVEERELVKDGIDALVLEEVEEQAEYGWTEGWFSVSMGIFGLIMRNMYVSKDILIDLAETQDADIHYTRESDAELLDNATRSIRLAAAAIFYTFIPGSIIIGLLTDRAVLGASILFAGVMLPILLLRIYNTRVTTGEQNRDRIMADTITDAATDADRVVAVLGGKHADGVEDHLPDDLDVTRKPIAYPARSLPHLKEIAVPVFTAFSVLFVLYLAILHLAALLYSTIL